VSAFWSGAQSGTADAVDVRHRMAAPAGRTLVLRMTVGGLLGLGRLLRPANPVLWILPHAVEVHARVKTARRAPVCLGVRVLGQYKIRRTRPASACLSHCFWHRRPRGQRPSPTHPTHLDPSIPSVGRRRPCLRLSSAGADTETLAREDGAVKCARVDWWGGWRRDGPPSPCWP